MLLLLGCAEPTAAERLAASAAAPDLEAALAACPPEHGACAMHAIVRFGAWARCGEAGHPWDDECRFRQAEALERADDGPGAFALCASTVFSVGCATHVAGQQARRADTVEEAEARWATLRAHTDARHAFAYWRGFWRTHIDRGDAPGLEACPSTVCRHAGEKEIEATVHSLEVPCRALDRPAPGWIPASSAASTAAWAAGLSHHCVPDAEHPVPAPLRGGR